MTIEQIRPLSELRSARLACRHGLALHGTIGSGRGVTNRWPEGPRRGHAAELVAETPGAPLSGGDPTVSRSDRPSLSGCLADMVSDLRTSAGPSPWNVPLTILFRLQFQFLASYRVARWIASTRRWHKIVTVPIRYWQHVVAGCHVSPFARIGRGVRFPHPLGIVIGEHVVIEDDVVVLQQVTFGSHGRKDAPAAYPVVQSGAALYAGAKVIGGMTIGRGAIVGANAVVLDDAPPGASAVGVPARSHTSRSAIEHQP